MLLDNGLLPSLGLDLDILFGLALTLGNDLNGSLGSLSVGFDI